jgi:protein-arginine kinase activator protein McsA
MLCSNCGRQPATHHYQATVNGRRQDRRLCDACAQQVAVASRRSHFGPLFGDLDAIYAAL